jgi:drug/metabolite transporter (DMT)-like permease
MSARVAIGAGLGIAGIAIVFWPELASVSASAKTARGAFYTVMAVITSAVGALTATGNTKRGVPVWQAMAFAMLYGALCSAVFAVATGATLSWDHSIAYLASLLYLAVLGSIVAFTGYFLLLERIGAARAGYIGVMVPILALVISWLFEGYVWRTWTFVGAALSIAGNALVLRRG